MLLNMQNSEGRKNGRNGAVPGKIRLRESSEEAKMTHLHLFGKQEGILLR